MPASSGQGGMPIPVKNNQPKMEAYQPSASVLIGGSVAGPLRSAAAPTPRPRTELHFPFQRPRPPAAVLHLPRQEVTALEDASVERIDFTAGHSLLEFVDPL